MAAQEAAAGKKRRSNTFRLVILKVLNFFIYLAVILLAVMMIYVLWNYVIVRGHLNGRIGIILSVVLGAVALFAFICQIEALFDRNDESITYFNINMSLVALVVSLTSLLTRFIF